MEFEELSIPKIKEFYEQDFWNNKPASFCTDTDIDFY